MQTDEAWEQAYHIVVACLPAGWIQTKNDQLSPKAIKLIDEIAKATENAYFKGKREVSRESQPGNLEPT